MIPSAPAGVSYHYGVPNITLAGTSVLAAEQAAVDLDYDANSRDRLSTKYYYQTDPVTKPFGYSQVGGFPVTQFNGAQVFAIDNTISFGSRVNWEQRLGFVRESSYSTYQQTLAGGNFGINGGAPDALTSNALVADELPGLSLAEFATKYSSPPSLTVGPYSAFVNTGYYQSRINPSTNLIYTIGHHTLIAGDGFSYTQLNIENNRQGRAELKSKSFQKFLTGDRSAWTEKAAGATMSSWNGSGERQVRRGLPPGLRIGPGSENLPGQIHRVLQPDQTPLQPERKDSRSGPAQPPARNPGSLTKTAPHLGIAGICSNKPSHLSFLLRP